MKKIITAIGNKYLNDILKEEYEVISKDVQYQDGIIEILNNTKEVDIILLSTEIMEEYAYKEFIQKILDINSKVEIIMFSNDIKNIDLNFLNSKKIYKIYENNNEGYNAYLLNLNTYKLPTNENIRKELEDFKENIVSNKQINKKQISKIKKQYKLEENIKNKKIYAISGWYGSRKNCFFNSVF